MDDNIWEYPFGDLDDDEEMFYNRPKPELISVITGFSPIHWRS
jgi:hypothetical protein